METPPPTTQEGREPSFSPPPTDPDEAVFSAIKQAAHYWTGKAEVTPAGRYKGLSTVEIGDVDAFDARYGPGAFHKHYDLIDQGSERLGRAVDLARKRDPNFDVLSVLDEERSYKYWVTQTLGETKPRREPIVTRADAIEPQSTKWLWPDHIPLSQMTILDGDPGMGKSQLALSLAARVTKGEPFPDETRTERPPMNVLYMTTEDDPYQTIVPRFIAAGGDRSRLHFFNAIRDEDGEQVPLAIPGDVDALRRVIAENDVRFIIIDPLVAFFGEEVNSYKDADVRRALAPLNLVLQDHEAACLAIRHFTKDTSKGALHRGGGTVGIIGFARSAFVVGYDPDDDRPSEERRFIIAHSKSNLARKQRAMAYSIEEVPLDDGIVSSRIRWEDLDIAVTADQLASPSKAPGPAQSARRDAIEHLQELMQAGPIPMTEATAKLTTYSPATLRRAKEDLGITSIRRGDQWYWVTPEQRPSLQTSLPERPYYTGDLTIKALRPDKPCSTCRGDHWIWLEGRGWHCNGCHPVLLH